jgi:hypothetical protein
VLEQINFYLITFFFRFRSLPSFFWSSVRDESGEWPEEFRICSFQLWILHLRDIQLTATSVKCAFCLLSWVMGLHRPNMLYESKNYNRPNHSILGPSLVWAESLGIMDRLILIHLITRDHSVLIFIHLPYTLRFGFSHLSYIFSYAINRNSSTDG